jgi:hypothetical protein
MVGSPVICVKPKPWEGVEYGTFDHQRRPVVRGRSNSVLLRQRERNPGHGVPRKQPPTKSTSRSQMGYIFDGSDHGKKRKSCQDSDRNGKNHRQTIRRRLGRKWSRGLRTRRLRSVLPGLHKSFAVSDGPPVYSSLMKQMGRQEDQKTPRGFTSWGSSFSFFIFEFLHQNLVPILSAPVHELFQLLRLLTYDHLKHT